MVNQGLQILINITCISPNTSIYLGDKSHFFETMFLLIDRFPNDTVWLLGHICNDGTIELSRVVNAQMFSKMAKHLSDGNLNSEVVCLTASQILQNFSHDMNFASEDGKALMQARNDLSQLVTTV